MWWHGRENSGGSWLPEEKKANMWPGRGNSGGSWPPAFPCSSMSMITIKRKKINKFLCRFAPISLLNQLKQKGKF